MRDFVNHILTPYFEHVKTELGLPPTQKALWQIDVWSVHQSQEFQNWMKTMHPLIIVDFVPGSCTGVHQPTDVGIQCPLKLSICQLYHEDIVQEFWEKIEQDSWVTILDDRLGTFRDCSVKWIWFAFTVLHNPDLIKKVA